MKITERDQEGGNRVKEGYDQGNEITEGQIDPTLEVARKEQKKILTGVDGVEQVVTLGRLFDISVNEQRVHL